MVNVPFSRSVLLRSPTAISFDPQSRRVYGFIGFRYETTSLFCWFLPWLFSVSGTAWCEGAGSGKPDPDGIGRFLPGLVGRALHRRIRWPLFLVVHRPSTRRTITRRVRRPCLRRVGSHQREPSLWDASLCARNKSPKADGVGVPGRRKEQGQDLPALAQRPGSGAQQPRAGHS